MENPRHVKFDPMKDLQSPRFRAIIRATSGRRRRSSDVKSFSHELNSNVPRNLSVSRRGGSSNPEDTMKLIRAKFNRLKEEVDAELGVYAGDLVSILETETEHPEWRIPIEDLLVVSQQCADMSLEEFWDKCEGIVQKLDDRRQELPMGVLKQVHTRILFILTRCTRLLQFHKECAYGGGGEGDHVLGFHQFSDLGIYPTKSGKLLNSLLSSKDIKERLIKRRIHEHEICSSSPSSRARISSWKKLPSSAEKNHVKAAQESLESSPHADKVRTESNVDDKKSMPQSDPLSSTGASDNDDRRSNLVDETPKMICRICDFEIPIIYAEDHVRVCTIADRCDKKGLTVDQRLEMIAQFLEKILESCMYKNSDTGIISSEDASDNLPTSSKKTDEAFHAQEGCAFRDIDTFSSEDNIDNMHCKIHLATPDQCINLSPGSAMPKSPTPTPSGINIDSLLTRVSAFSELENLEQIQSLLTIVRNIMSVTSIDYHSLEDLSTYLEDLNGVIDDRKVDALLIETFGKRIELLLQEKFVKLCGQIDDENKDSAYTMTDEDSCMEYDSSSSRASPIVKKYKERTSIEDFEIIKPISRGAFGRVFLAKKRITGDIFAIKVLKKADMIRKNAVESILAERNILISARNPFVVRFFYSFTCRENLYLVMEYLNGGDLYSLLRNLGCLDEEMACMYIAELVLALEYLHSLNVIHRDLKPDNLLIAHNGHIKLTDFGLSKVGLINSTDDLSGPDVSNSFLPAENEQMPAKLRAQQREQRQRQSAVGTPDYLSPEILLGMQHGPTADWWSVGVILFELLVGIPPFNAEHPQKIFDNIMNRDIPWPQVPEEMSYEARDLIDKLLIENPVQRLGATGAAEVKSHSFFRNINWDKLSMQKATFIPSTEADDDTSYFSSRHSWSEFDENIYTAPDSFNDASDGSSCSSQLSCDDEEEGDECGNLADFAFQNLCTKYSFSNFSFKNLSQLASINYDLITKSNKDSADSSTTL